jgi:hypothetical protein
MVRSKRRADSGEVMAADPRRDSAIQSGIRSCALVHQGPITTSSMYRLSIGCRSRMSEIALWSVERLS